MEIQDLKKAFEKADTKKISMNLNGKILEMIDELAEIPGINRSQMIDALIEAGFVYQTEFFEKAWKNFLNDKKYSDKQNLLKDMLRKLEKFKERWHVEKIPLPS